MFPWRGAVKNKDAEWYFHSWQGPRLAQHKASRLTFPYLIFPLGEQRDAVSHVSIGNAVV